MNAFAYGIENNEEEFAEFDNVFKGIRFISWFVGTLTLIAGIIGISNIMLIIVKERTKEIGIRRAIGASPFSIISQVFWRLWFSHLWQDTLELC